MAYKSRKNRSNRKRHNKKRRSVKRGGEEGWKEYRNSGDLGNIDFTNDYLPEDDMKMREAESDFDSYNETQLQGNYDKLVNQYKAKCNANNKWRPDCVYLTQKVNDAYFKLQKAEGNEFQKIGTISWLKRKMTQRKKPDNYGGRKTRRRKSRKHRK